MTKHAVKRQPLPSDSDARRQVKNMQRTQQRKRKAESDAILAPAAAAVQATIDRQVAARLQHGVQTGTLFSPGTTRKISDAIDRQLARNTKTLVETVSSSLAPTPERTKSRAENVREQLAAVLKRMHQCWKDEAKVERKIMDIKLHRPGELLEYIRDCQEQCDKAKASLRLREAELQVLLESELEEAEKALAPVDEDERDTTLTSQEGASDRQMNGEDRG